MMKKFNIKTLALSLSAVMTTAVVTPQAQASDIEIYTTADQAQKTIVMMLDTSGSMRLCDVDVSLVLDWRLDNGSIVKGNISYNLASIDYFNQNGALTAHNKQTIGAYIGVDKSNTSPQYERNYCYGQNAAKQRTNVKHYDRMTKLKDAVFALMDSDELDSTMHIAVGQFTDTTKGTIQIPAAPLTDEHRKRIKEYIAQLGASGATPTASAFAEAAAYMMGTNTIAKSESTTTTYQRWVWFPQDSKYHYCGRKDGSASRETDADSTLNIDSSGACTGAYGSTLTTMTKADALARGYKEEACRGLNGNGLVYTHWGDLRTTCLYKDGETVNSSVLGGDSRYNAIYSGFAKSVRDAKTEDGKNYKSPLPTTGRECSGQAIYFLTDGEPNGADNSQYLMQAALGNKGTNFPLKLSDFSDTTKYLPSNNDEGMAPAGELAKRLRDPAQNPQGVSVPTALVGFGADFIQAKNTKIQLTDSKGKVRDYYDCSKISKQTIKNACNFAEKSHASLPGVGGYGEGGFFYAEDAKDVINSFLSVANNIEIKFNPITTGSPTIPVSSLNKQSLLADAYYASFVPLPEKTQQLWTGNMNKYTTDRGTLYGQSGQALFKDGGLINTATLGLWDNEVNNEIVKGVLGNLKLRTDEQHQTQRQVYTEGTGDSRALTQVTVDSLRDGELSGSSDKNYWLNLLGYGVSETENVDFTKLSEKPELRQLGATMHSSPILLTQSGKINTQLEESNRDDYLVYGSTQGVLHIVDADTGEEKFAFVPQKMVEKQKQAFLQESATTGGKSNLFYGVDGAWVAHTEYVPRSDGTLTVGLSNPSDANSAKGKQWVYGGLRMGGKNYYSLDLGSIANTAKQGQNDGQISGAPVLKFNIDPEAGVVYTSSGRKAYPELAKMGQSWSKPSLGYVRWNGERRLVMFVGGGYDVGYEKSDYIQTNGEGAGVYMFDANTGDLLWWASNNAVTGGTANKHSATGDDNGSLQYSVVSRINTIDRDSDGLIDALYFGDLAGQGFRIDLNNANKINANGSAEVPFSIRVVKIFDEHVDDGLSPRLYEMPSISVQEAEDGSRFAVVAFGSGDRSSPLAGERVDAYGNKITKNANTADDATIVVYDYDLGKTAWRTLTMDGLQTRHTKGALKPAVLDSNLKGTESEVKANYINQGWKYTYPANKKGGFKTFGEPYAITDLLFVNTYDRDGGGLDSQCGGGVIGVSQAYQFCLPTGICEKDKHGYERNEETPLVSLSTPGLVEMTLGLSEKGVGNLGNISTNSSSTDSSISSDVRVDCSKTENQPKLECLNVEMPSVLSQLRWFESRQEQSQN